MPKVKVDDKEVEVNDGMTVLQACEQAGVEIPRFCYHERLAIAGNCRMCLVEVEKSPKPVASCAMPVMEGMVIHTNTPTVKKAREGVMEFLLINHPLDCPICDQGGECDLQDQAMHYGKGINRFHENKRSVPDKDLGPLIKTFMTRCIHCTRCIRFSQDIAGNEELGAVYRGEDMEVGTYIEKAITSELSGNMIDLCPVGALTSKPYAYKARSWELKATESIDVMDAVGSNIRIDTRGIEVMRILPRLNEEINEEWISDKTRFAYDGLKMQRLDRPLIKKENKFEEATFEEAFEYIAKKLKNLKGQEIAAIAGDHADLESMYILKDIMTNLNCPNIDCRQEGEKFTSGNRSSYIFNTTIEGIDKADFCLLVGANPRHEAPIINARIRKNYLDKNLEIASIGNKLDLTYPVNNLGDDPKLLEQILEEKHPLSNKLKHSNNPMIILGISPLCREDGEKILSLCQKIADKYMIRKDWNGFNILHKAASRVGGLDIGFVPNKEGKDIKQIHQAADQGIIKFVYLLDADEIDPKKLNKSFVVYQGHHGDKGAHIADVILPGACYTEKNAVYVNTEGRLQKTSRAVFAPNKAREDFRILVSLAEYLNIELKAKNSFEIIELYKKEYKNFANIGKCFKSNWQVIESDVELINEKIKVKDFNFYMTDPISRSSKTMAECTKIFNIKQEVA